MEETLQKKDMSGEISFVNSEQKEGDERRGRILREKKEVGQTYVKAQYHGYTFSVFSVQLLILSCRSP